MASCVLGVGDPKVSFFWKNLTCPLTLVLAELYCFHILIIGFDSEEISILLMCAIVWSDVLIVNVKDPK